MRRQRTGNVLILASVLILGLLIVVLGLAQLTLRHVKDQTYMVATGFAPYQARLAAEAGVNAMLRAANTSPWNNASNFTNLASTTFFAATSSYGQPYTATYSVTYLGPLTTPANGARIASSGSVIPPGPFPVVTKSVVADLASGSAWTLASMSYSP